MAAYLVDVRSSPNNGHQAAVLQCPLRANRIILRRTQTQSVYSITSSARASNDGGT